MTRLTWFAAGAVAGVYAMVKAKRTAQNFTPAGVAARVAALGAGFREFRSQVGDGMATREAELRAELRTAELRTAELRTAELRTAGATPALTSNGEKGAGLAAERSTAFSRVAESRGVDADR